MALRAARKKCAHAHTHTGNFDRDGSTTAPLRADGAWRAPKT
jgi:hypothetical protein